MSVKLIDNEAFYGFRVRRTVNGKLYQEYFSLKKSGNRLGPRQTAAVRKVAEARDDELRIEQEKSKQRRKAELCFHDDGSVKGISYLIKTEKSGTRTPIFQIGIASELDNKIICTSFSINAHGAGDAWKRAVDTYASHKLISRNSKLYKKLLAAMPRVTEDKARPASARRKAAASKSVTRRKSAAAKRPAVKKAAKKAATKKASTRRNAGAAAGKRKVAATRKTKTSAGKRAATRKKAVPAKSKAKPAGGKRGAAKKRPARKKSS